MASASFSELSQELVELFDMKKAKLRSEKELTQEANETQKDIRLLTLMFREGIPDIAVEVSENEVLRWDARGQQLLYMQGKVTSILEATTRETRIRLRPFLSQMVKKAKNLYL